MKKLIALMTLVGISQLDADSVTFKNDTPDTLTVSLKSKYKKKKNGGTVTRHDQKSYTLKPSEQAKLDYRGDIQIFDIVDTTQPSIPKPYTVQFSRITDSTGFAVDQGSFYDQRDCADKYNNGPCIRYFSITLGTDRSTKKPVLKTKWKSMPGSSNTNATPTETPSDE